MPACLNGDALLAFQRVNTLSAAEESDCFCVAPDHSARALNRLVRGYAALASCVVTARQDGAAVNLYLPGRYAVSVNDELLIFTVKASASGATITVHCKQATEATVRARIPTWSRTTEVTINGVDNHEEVKNGMIAFDRTWHDGDMIELTFEQTLRVLDGHHQGKYILQGPVLMALSAEGENWKKAYVSVTAEEHRVAATLDPVKEWKVKDGVPADLPVLPETEGAPAMHLLAPYARTAARIALFPGRRQA